MKTGRIPKTTKQWLAVILPLALLPSLAIATDEATRNEQLMAAAGRGDLALVTTLLIRGADVNARGRDGRTALMWAAAWDHADVVKLPLDKGADLNTKDKHNRTPLKFAEERGHKELVELLKAHGAKE